ncbi:MAG: peptidase dimerization domain-containing protein, partial [Rhodobacteraceae bacterium]|nr:peptidase dimerization domain-containing protein [Paracoccaceae bacterium]
MWGGYCWQGFKTVLPAEAHAKISFRLVGEQDPLKIANVFRSYVEHELPADCKAVFHEIGGHPAATVPIDCELVRDARDALSEEWGTQAIFVGSGVSIPVVGHFKKQQ